MAKRELFGTDGVRGVANVYPMTVEVALKLGRAVAHLFRQRDTRRRIVVGKDTRLSCYMFETALSAGICSMGAECLLTGPLPTPAIAHLTASMRADAGVVISASHNPYQDNGIKVFASDGFKLPDETELELERLMTQAGDELDDGRVSSERVGRVLRIQEVIGRYIEFAKKTFPDELSLEGVKVVVDCANGAAYRVAPIILEELGADVVRLGVDPNGRNINDNCGALYPQNLKAHVLEHGANIGIALDGDADRVIVADEKGEVVDGDSIMALIATRMLKAGRLQKNTLVATVMSNLGLEHCITSAGAKLVRTNVGDRYVVDEMRRGGYNLGGEQSGHLIFLDHVTTGDGIVGALQVLAAMVREQKPLSELASVMTRLPQVLVNVRVDQKKPLEQLESVQKLIADAESKLGSDGRVLVRYSGTEAKARVMVEGVDEAVIQGLAEAIANDLQRACRA
ncbi:MAG: phosphoglucosamine mutase [Myxococcales bacterium]|nr:phosphoglucosamine mutase [Myxococcales bacterium]